MSIVRVLRFTRRQLQFVPRALYSSIAEPLQDGAPKEFHPKLHNLVNEISKLTLLEVSELNQLLKKTLNIPDAPMMAMSAMAPAAAEVEEEVEVKIVKSSFTVKLMKYDEEKKVQLIKQLKTLMTGMNLVQAKKFVESAPQIVKADLGKTEAEQLSEAITAAGGVCEIE